MSTLMHPLSSIGQTAQFVWPVSRGDGGLGHLVPLLSRASGPPILEQFLIDRDQILQGYITG